MKVALWNSKANVIEEQPLSHDSSIMVAEVAWKRKNNQKRKSAILSALALLMFVTQVVCILIATFVSVMLICVFVVMSDDTCLCYNHTLPREEYRVKISPCTIALT
jgi:hypothetical protein